MWTVFSRVVRAARAAVWVTMAALTLLLSAVAASGILNSLGKRTPTISDRVVQVLVDFHGETVYVDDSLMYDLGMDSVDSTRVAGALEEEFNIMISGEEAEQAACGTVQDYIDLVRDKLGLPQ